MLRTAQVTVVMTSAQDAVQRRAKARPSATAPMWLSVAVLMLAMSVLSTQAVAEPSYSRSPRFRIPFEFEAAELTRLRVQEVLLFVSSDHGKTWQEAGSAPPKVGQIPFEASGDGEYWFAVKTRSENGQMLPKGPHQVSLEVLVDSTAPELKLEVDQPEPGRVRLAWEASDTTLDATSVTLEYLDSRTARWEPVGVRSAATGQTTWTVERSGEVLIRASVLDLAGNQKTAEASVTVQGSNTRPETPDFTRPVATDSPASPQPYPTGSIRNTSVGQLPPALPELRPAPSRHQQTQQIAAQSNVSAVPLPFAAGSAVTANTPAVTGPALTLPAPAETSTQPSIPAPAAVSSLPAPAAFQTAASVPSTPVPLFQEPAGNGLRPATGNVVNSNRFRIEYNVKAIGPSGVRTVHVYITEDGGRKWWHFGADADRQSPFDVEVPGDGTYGFAFRVENGVGNMAPPPQPGEVPDVTVSIDQIAPVVQLMPLQQPALSAQGQVQLQWTARDQQLADRPVSLYYATSRSGPWTLIEREYANTGSYVWSVPALGPNDQLFVRIEVRDQAGNVGVHESDRPLMIDLSQPAVEVLGVQSLGTLGR